MMKIMTPGEIMDTAIDILRKNIKTTILYGIGFSVVTFIIIVVIMILIMLFGGFFSLRQTTDSSVFIMSFLGSLYFVSFGAFYFSFGVGIIKISAQDILNYQVYAHQLIKSSLQAFFKVFTILIIIGIISLPVIGGLVVIISLLFSLFGEVHLFNFAGSISGIQQILMIIFSIILVITIIFLLMAYLTIFCFTLHAAFIERKGAIDSIKRSFELVKGDFKQVCGYFILFSLVTFAINASLQGLIILIAGIFFLIMKLLNIQVNYVTFLSSFYTYTRLPYNIINWLIVSPVNFMMLTILYFNQRYKLEGYDIILKLKELQNNTERE